MLRAKLIVLVATAMLLAQLPCIAACAGQVCDTVSSASLPPCHRHHNHSQGSSPNCLHQAMFSSAIPGHTLHAELQLVAVGSPAVVQGLTLLPETRPREAAPPVASPPGQEELSSVVLRI